MFDDVYLRDHACYLNEVNRDGCALTLLRKSLSIASRCTWPSVDMHDFVATGRYWTECEYIIDLFRVAVGIENYLKARLILDDFVVHEIAPAHPSGLSEWQKDRHILVRELGSLYEKQDSRTGIRSISGLTRRTIGFSSLLNFPPNYLPTDLQVIATRVGRQRNTLHYLESEPGDIACSDMGLVTDFMAADIPDRVNALATKRNWPAMMYRSAGVSSIVNAPRVPIPIVYEKLKHRQ